MKTSVTVGWAIAVGLLFGAILVFWHSPAGRAQLGSNVENQATPRVLADDSEPLDNQEAALMVLAQDVGKLGDLSLTKAWASQVAPQFADEALEYSVVTMLPKPTSEEEVARNKDAFDGQAAAVYGDILPALKTPGAQVRVLSKLLLRMQTYGRSAFVAGGKEITRNDLVQQAVTAGKKIPMADAPRHGWLNGSTLIGLVTAFCVALSQLLKSFVETIARTVGSSLADSFKNVLPAGAMTSAIPNHSPPKTPAHDAV